MTQERALWVVFFLLMGIAVLTAMRPEPYLAVQAPGQATVPTTNPHVRNLPTMMAPLRTVWGSEQDAHTPTCTDGTLLMYATLESVQIKGPNNTLTWAPQAAVWESMYCEAGHWRPVPLKVAHFHITQ